MLKQAIGIFGGTFDPIHFGHLRTALELYQSLELANVRLVPCYQPVHRKNPVASPAHRLAMVKVAIADEPALIVDDCEIKRAAPSFTVETLEMLRQQFPHTPFCLIMGIDALLGFSSWHRWQDILSLAHLVVAHRPHYQLPKTGAIADLLKQRLQTSPLSIHDAIAGHVILQPVTALEISATDIRRQFASGRNPRYLLPDSVYEYIQKEGVYSISGKGTLANSR
ncbi:MAG: nicotinate-nucleotide adenylyltransferase [Gammaproteobacteria bacterium]|nr:nicotinate-nucleotide adenylyltransferase [Gammaproteobacteria bacterium]